MSQTSLALTPPRDVPPCGFNGCPANHQAPSQASRGNSGLVLPLSAGSPGSTPGGKLVPVALRRSESGGMGFSVTAGGQGGQLAVVRRVWDRRHCPSLQPGDTIVKINGADVQSHSFSQVKYWYLSKIQPVWIKATTEQKQIFTIYMLHCNWLTRIYITIVSMPSLTWALTDILLTDFWYPHCLLLAGFNQLPVPCECSTVF